MRARIPEDALPQQRQRGFILLEAMVATAIFAMAVLALAQCIESGLQAGVAQRDDARARRALSNRMRELEGGAQPYVDILNGVELKGEFAGMVLRQTIVPLELIDQNKAIVDDLFGVTLEVSWQASARSRAVKQLMFYAYPKAG
ncbi:MAG: prepilin-type N-terminal cleavage/methylation domain-containing protein [Verrucomicrobiota bacterium]